MLENAFQIIKNKKMITVVLVFLLIILSIPITYAEGILNNGTYGITIDIYSAPYSTTYATKGYAIGTGVVYGPYGCGWFASARVNQLTGKSVPLYNGASWWKNAKSQGFSRGNSIPTGKALICYKDEVSDDNVEYAHVEVIEGFTGDNVIISTGGYLGAPNNGYCGIFLKNASSYLSQSNIQGFVYLDSQLSPMLSDNKNVVRTGEDIVFYYSGLTEASKVEICFEKNGEVYYFDDTTASRTYTTYFNNEGQYYVFVRGLLNGTWYTSAKLLVDVTNPVFDVSTTTPNQNQKIVFSYDKLTNANKVELFLEKNGAIYHTYDMTKSKTYNYQFDSVGIYKAYIIADYSGTSIMSDIITVNVSPEQVDEDRGSEMSSGYERVLPDGDYQILSSLNPAYDLDIVGDSVADNGTDIQLWESGPRAYDIFTLKYSDSGEYKGFYTITQKGTNKVLTVDGTEEDSRISGMRLDMWELYDSPKQQWAICNAYSGNGYAVQAKCSGFLLTVNSSTPTRGTSVVQKKGDGSSAQSWAFIPYKPKQTLANGRYILVSALDDSLELDVSGDTGDVPNETNVQVWHYNATSRYNSFDVVALDNGYYTLTHIASGKGLTSLGGGVAFGQNIAIFEEDGSSAQEWAITKDGDNGGYVLRTRCSGLVMDVMDGGTANGTNVRQWPYNGTKAQTWKFVPAESRVTYNANGGALKPNDQIKYYREKLTLSMDIPKHSNRVFIGWATSPNGSVVYHPGDIYETDENLTLYAVWLADETILKLPAELTRIEEEAFANVAADAVVIPAGVTEIGAGAFGNIIIMGYKGTVAEEYANANGLTFISLDDN